MDIDEIKVGEYIRTDKGNVGKIIEIRLGRNIDKKEFQNIYKLDKGLWTVRQYIVKHSPNLIDIIEERRLCKWKKNRCYHRWFLKARRGWRKGTLF